MASAYCGRLRREIDSRFSCAALARYECLEIVQVCRFAKLATPSPIDYFFCQHWLEGQSKEHQICIRIAPSQALLPQCPVSAICHVHHGILPCFPCVPSVSFGCVLLRTIAIPRLS